MLYRIIAIAARSLAGASFMPMPAASHAGVASQVNTLVSPRRSSPARVTSTPSSTPSSPDHVDDPMPVEPQWEGQWQILKYL